MPKMPEKKGHEMRRWRGGGYPTNTKTPGRTNRYGANIKIHLKLFTGGNLIENAVSLDECSVNAAFLEVQEGLAAHLWLKTNILLQSEIKKLCKDRNWDKLSK